MPDSQLHQNEDLSQRLGAEKLRQRLDRQARHRARLTHQQEGIFHLERFFSVDALVERCLRLALLWPRAHANAFKIRPVEQVWELPNLPAAFEGFRLLQLSDLHSDIHPDLAPAIADAVSACPHDGLVVTGDFRNRTKDDHGPSMAVIPMILAGSQAPRFAILGNHDFIEKVPDLESAGLPVLLNESTAIEKEGQKLWIAGVDDPHFYKTHDFFAARKGIPANAASILLCHTPEVHAEAAQYGFSLMLSGHTHGGQLCLPGGRHLVCPTKGLPRRFIRGRWKSGAMQGYTSVGTGCCGVAARLNCPAEITLHVLKGR